ncbi:MAG: hypothetical protein HC769_25955 [Cyanobacteria bacterium CRU_2_1]|nr:hypothetical protein [Cyanobacteria bacterium CRU_2_1]
MAAKPHSSADLSVTNSSNSQHQPKWCCVFAEARTQILLCYIGLMALFVGLSIPVIYHALSQRVIYRVREEVSGEVIEFVEDAAQQNLDRPDQLKLFMIHYLENERVESGLYFITILDHQFFSLVLKNCPNPCYPIRN